MIRALAPSLRAIRPALRSSAFIRNYSNTLASTFPLFASGEPIVRYTENHEWIAALKGEKRAYIGITKYAADALGDTTFIEVNDVPSTVEEGDSIGSVESVKSASDVYSPVAGELVARNDPLIDNTALLNKDPMGEAWLAQIEMENAEDLEKLLTLEQYKDNLEDAH